MEKKKKSKQKQNTKKHEMKHTPPIKKEKERDILDELWIYILQRKLKIDFKCYWRYFDCSFNKRS